MTTAAKWVEVEGEVLPSPAPRPCPGEASNDDAPASGMATLFTSPASGRSCLLYRVELTPLQRLLEASSSPCRERAGRRFILRDSDGACWPVDPRAARLRWSPHPRWLAIGEQQDRDERLRQLYWRLGRSLRRRVVRLREWRIDVGDRLHVAAWLQQVFSPDGEPAGYRQPPALALLVAASLCRI